MTIQQIVVFGFAVIIAAFVGGGIKLLLQAMP